MNSFMPADIMSSQYTRSTSARLSSEDPEDLYKSNAIEDRNFTAESHNEFVARPTRNVMAWETVEFGEVGTLHYRLLFFNENSIHVSPQDDLPLHTVEGNTNFVCLTPQGSWVDFEVAKEEIFYPIRVREHRNLPSHFANNCKSWQYGFLPQTWMNPVDRELEMGNLRLKEGQLEVIVLGVSNRITTGSIFSIDILGAFPVVTPSGNLRWVVVGVPVQEQNSNAVPKSLQDLQKQTPGALNSVRNWLTKLHCNIEEGEIENSFANGGNPVDKPYALKIVAEAHASWQLRRSVLEEEGIIQSSNILSSQSVPHFQKLLGKRLEGVSSARIPLSQPNSSACEDIDRAWAQVNVKDRSDTKKSNAAKLDQKSPKEASPTGANPKKAAIFKFLKSMAKKVKSLPMPSANQKPKFQFQMSERGYEGEEDAADVAQRLQGFQKSISLTNAAASLASPTATSPEPLRLHKKSNSISIVPEVHLGGSDEGKEEEEEEEEGSGSLDTVDMGHVFGPTGKGKALAPADPTELVARSSPLAATFQDEAQFQQQRQQRQQRRAFRVVKSVVPSSRRSPSESILDLEFYNPRSHSLTRAEAEGAALGGRRSLTTSSGVLLPVFVGARDGNPSFSIDLPATPPRGKLSPSLSQTDLTSYRAEEGEGEEERGEVSGRAPLSFSLKPSEARAPPMPPKSPTSPRGGRKGSGILRARSPEFVSGPAVARGPSTRSGPLQPRNDWEPEGGSSDSTIRGWNDVFRMAANRQRSPVSPGSPLSSSPPPMAPPSPPDTKFPLMREHSFAVMMTNSSPELCVVEGAGDGRLPSTAHPSAPVSPISRKGTVVSPLRSGRLVPRNLPQAPTYTVTKGLAERLREQQQQQQQQTASQKVDQSV